MWGGGTFFGLFLTSSYDPPPSTPPTHPQLELEKEMANMNANIAEGAQTPNPESATAPTAEDLLLQNLLLKQHIVKGI